MDTSDDARYPVGDTESLISIEDGRQQDINNDATDILQTADSAAVDALNCNECGTSVKNRTVLNNFATNDSQIQTTETVYGDECDAIVEDQRRFDNDTIGSVQNQNANSRVNSFRRQYGLSSSFVFMTLMMCVGPRIVIIPIAISNGGLMFGTAGIFVLAVISIHCSHLVAFTNDKLNKKRSHSSLNYFETVEEAFLKGPVRLRRFAPCMSQTAHAFSHLAEFGSLIEAFLFLAGSMHEIVTNLHGSTSINEKGFIVILLPFVVISSIILNFNFLGFMACFQRIVNLAAITAIIITYSYCIPGPYSASVIPYVAPLHRIPHYFGCIMYIFEGTVMHLPMRGAMAYPEDFLGLTGVFTTGKMFAYAVYGGLGFFGYLKHGENTRSSLSFNLPKTSWGETARIFYALYMFIGILFQLYILISFCIWPVIKKWFELNDISDKRKKQIETGLRLLFIAITSGIALFIPDIDLLIGLIGSLGVGPLVLIFPPLINMITIWNSDTSKWKLVLTCLKDITILLFGLVACTTGTYVALRDIVNGFSDMSDIKF